MCVVDPVTVPPSGECGRSEFRCNEGTCIDAYLVCDRSYDCRDGSDEHDCGLSFFSAKLFSLPTPTLSIDVDRTFESVCLSVCLFSFVCPEHNSKTKDPKVFKHGIGMTLSYPTSDMVLGLKGQWSKLGLGLRSTAIRRGFQLCECLLVSTVLLQDIM